MTDTVETYDEPVSVVLRKALMGPREALAGVCLSEALGAKGRRLLQRRKAAAIVITVPSAEWIEPVASAVSAIHAKAKIVDPHTKPNHKVEETKAAARLIAAGHTVVGIAHEASQLPEVLNISATHTVEIRAPNAKILARAMSLCLAGRLSRGLRDLDLTTFDFDVLCACMPSGSTKKEALANLKRVFAKRITEQNTHSLELPALESAVEYGEARRWALALKDDIADLRSGKITWADVDRGCVLEGPPGSGKTTFAKIIGRACGLEVIVGSVPEFFASSAGYLDSVVKAQRELFARAAAAAPCILFLDEINAMPDLATISPRGKDWWTPVVLDFYLLLDSMIASRDGVIVIGATNRIEDISPVLLRPGRLERFIHIGPLDEAGMTNVLRTQLGDDLRGEDLGGLARMGAGATAAVAMDWVRSARRVSRRAGRPMSVDDLAEQVAPKDGLTADQKHLVSIHEAGHGVVGAILGLQLIGITIAPLGNSGGRTSFEQERGRLVTREELERQIIMILSGNAAEAVLLGSASVGSGGERGSDLAKATVGLAAMHASYGLGGTLGWRAPPHEIEAVLSRDGRLRTRVEGDLQRLHRRAVGLVQQHAKAIAATAVLLRHSGSATAADISEVIRLYSAGSEASVAENSDRTDEILDKSVQIK